LTKAGSSGMEHGNKKYGGQNLKFLSGFLSFLKFLSGEKGIENHRF